eukprot:3614260-Prymnesium_polylepis.1
MATLKRQGTMDKMEKSVGTMFSWLAPKENSERSTLERKQSERRSARKSEGDEVNWAFSSLDEFEEFLKNFTNAASIAKEFATKPHWYHIIRIAFDEGEDLLDWVDKIINYDGELVSLTAACSEEGEQSSFECFQYNVLHFIAYMVHGVAQRARGRVGGVRARGAACARARAAWVCVRRGAPP